MKATYETFLPLFKGTYGNFWEEDQAEEIFKEDFEESKGIVYNNDLMFKSIGKSVINHLEENFPFEIKIKYQDYYSPKYYNYSNDSINVSIELDTTELRKYILENYNYFAKRIKEEYTSCSGFISSYFNNIEEWATDTNNFTSFSINKHYLGALLNIVCEIEQIEEINAYYDWIDCNDYNYIEIY